MPRSSPLTLELTPVVTDPPCSGWSCVGRWVHPLLASVVLLAYILVLLRYFPARDELSYVSLGFKGVLAVMAVLGLFMLVAIRDAEHRAYGPLFFGLLFFAVAFSTDSMAELVTTAKGLKLVGERLSLVVGFALVLRGLLLWSRHTLMVNAKLAQQAITDELTGVFNRRHAMHELNRKAAIATRHPESLFSAMLFDVDHFKQINDVHGHEAGDQVLVSMARQVRAELRTEDTLARVGGEEFLVLMPATDREGALQLAERLRLAVRQVRFDEHAHATASFGADVYEPGEPVDKFLKRLDQAMYQSKRNGRDRVTLARRG